MNLSEKNRKANALWVIGTFAACALIFLGVQNISSVAAGIAWVFKLFSPLVIGCALALVLNVPLRFFERHLFTKTKKPALKKLSRPLAFIISILLILGILAGVIMLVIPELVEAIKVIVEIVTDFVNRLLAMSEEEILELPFGEYLLNTDWKNLLTSAQNWLKDQGGALVNTAFTTIGSVITAVVNFGIGAVFAVYILLSKDKLGSQVKRLIIAWIPKKAGNAVMHVAAVAAENFRNFISGQTLEAMILGGLCMLGMLILRIPYAPMVGALVGVTALIPVIGGFIGAGVGAVMIITQSPVKALIFVIFLTVLQQIEGNLIYPKVMGTRVSLPAIWILAAVTLGGSIAGPLGMIISVPFASTCYSLLKDLTASREKKLAQMKEENSPEPAEEATE